VGKNRISPGKGQGRAWDMEIVPRCARVKQWDENESSMTVEGFKRRLTSTGVANKSNHQQGQPIDSLLPPVWKATRRRRRGCHAVVDVFHRCGTPPRYECGQ